jgi:DNA-binding transcriptional regulator YiaG
MSPPKQALDELCFGRESSSQADVARLLDVPVGTVGNWVRGHHDPVGNQMRPPTR